QNITPALAEGLGLSRSYGVVISDVTPGGPAEAAGLKIGDIVVTADERRIDTLPGLTAVMYLHPLDEVMKLVILRGTQKEILEIPVLEHRDPMDKIVDAVDPEKSLVRRLGILAVDLSPQLKSLVGDLRISSGVVVVARTADLLGPETDLRTGDVIHSVNSISIDSLDSLRARLREVKPGAPVVLQVERDSKLEWVAFEME
ncbi:MAG: PDZ domain-containing protein, partial [Terriglobales bacterium]